MKVPELVKVSLEVNGHRFEGEVEPRKTLADFLREELGFTGVNLGCEHGVCGMCTVLVNGQTARSCLMFAVQADGASITTVEGVGTPSKMHPLQQAFWEKHGLQCGFCTPAMLVTALELLNHNPTPSRDEIREAISSNLCRCTGYAKIVDAIRHAAGEDDGKGGS